MAFLNNAGLERVWEKITAKLNTKVDKIDGKGLSTNDYTTAEKNKLAGIATGATKVTVDSALSSSSTNPVQNKAVNAAISNLNALVGDASVATQIANAKNGCITGLSVSGQTVTYTKGDGSTGTIATQDLKTRQTLTTGNTNYPLLMAQQANTVTTSNVDNVTYRNNSIYANPSTGMIASASSKIGEHVTLQYDSTNECLNFVFS